MKLIRDIVRGREAYSVSPDMTVQDVAEYLCERKVGAVAIVEDYRVIGVFSERDLMSRVVCKELDPKTTPVRDVMTPDAVYVMIHENAATAKSLMLGKNFRHLVVLDESEHLQGFVSMRELLEVDLEESQELIQKLNDDYYHEDFKPKK
jgi:CBS domain-containing protein